MLGPLADDLARRLGAAELLADDRALQGVGRLLAAAVAARDVPVQVAAFDGGQAKPGGALVGANDAAHQGRLSLGRRIAGAVLVRPVLLQEVPDLLAELLVLGAVAQIHLCSSIRLATQRLAQPPPCRRGSGGRCRSRAPVGLSRARGRRKREGRPIPIQLSDCRAGGKSKRRGLTLGAQDATIRPDALPAEHVPGLDLRAHAGGGAGRRRHPGPRLRARHGRHRLRCAHPLLLRRASGGRHSAGRLAQARLGSLPAPARLPVEGVARVQDAAHQHPHVRRDAGRAGAERGAAAAVLSACSSRRPSA